MGILTSVNSMYLLSAVVVVNSFLWTYILSPYLIDYVWNLTEKTEDQTLSLKTIKTLNSKLHIFKPNINISFKIGEGEFINPPSQSSNLELEPAQNIQFHFDAFKNITDAFNESFEKLNAEVQSINTLDWNNNFSTNGLGMQPLKDPRRLYFKDFCKEFGIDLKIPANTKGKTALQQLDELMADFQEDKSLLIIANIGELSSKDPYSRKMNVETFFNGVDIVTNFRRENFFSRGEVTRFIDDLTKKYEKTVMIMSPDDQWSFGHTASAIPMSYNSEESLPEMI